MINSIQSFFRSVGNFASLNTNSNGSANSETNSKGLAEECANPALISEWVVNPGPIVSAIYTATERQVAFPLDIVNLVTEYLQNYEALKSLSIFGPADWTTTFNKKVEKIQPPPEMDAFLQKINPFTGKLNAESCVCVFIPSHYQDIPQNTKEEQELVNQPLIPLTPATMEELAKNPSNPENQSKLESFLDYYSQNFHLLQETRKELLNLHAKKSFWAVITLNVIPDSLDKFVFQQKNLINKKGSKEYWQVPSIREAIICAFAHYAKTGVRMFNGNSMMYTRCVEMIDFDKIVVGGFTATGLNVKDSSYWVHHSHGIVVIRKFDF